MMMGRDKKKVAMLILGGLKKKDSSEDKQADFVDKGEDGYSSKEEFPSMEEKKDEEQYHGHMAAMEDFIGAVKSGDAKAALEAWSNISDMGSYGSHDEYSHDKKDD